MKIATVEDKSAALRLLFEQADQKIISSLSRSPQEYRSAAEFRAQFNEARSMKAWAMARLSALESPRQ